MAERIVQAAPGEKIVVVGSKLSGHPNTAKTRYAVQDGRAPVPPPPPFSYVSSITGGTLAGLVAWTAQVTAGVASRMEFYVDGRLEWTESFAPYRFGGDDPDGFLDTRVMTNGPHDLAVRGYDAQGVGGLFAGGVVTIANGTPVPDPPPPTPGSSMPTDVPAGWRVLIQQDFPIDVAEGQWPGPYAADWGAYPKDWRDTARSQGRRGGLYDPAMISVKDGKLRVRFATIAGTRRIAVPTLVPGGQSNWPSAWVQYAIQVENVVGNGHGFKTALLFWPKSNTWPRDGEIDFVEGDLDSTMSGFMHRQGASSGSDQYAVSSQARYTDPHVAGIKWVGGTSCEFFLDGASLGRTTTRVPSTDMHYVLQCETSLSSAEAIDTTTGFITFPWVRFLVPA